MKGEIGMRYPNGESFNHSKVVNPRSEKNHLFSKRGMHLEEMINQANKWYLARDIAIIHKKPTPIQVVNVDYPKRSRAVIKEAYYRQASTTDYNGIYQGYYIDFEAKQTDLVNHFPLNNIHEHQVNHMRNCYHHGGICFLIIYFKSRQELFLYPFEALDKDWQLYKKNEQKHISIERITKIGYPIIEGFQPRIDYIQALNQYLQTIKERSELNESTSQS